MSLDTVIVYVGLIAIGMVIQGCRDAYHYHHNRKDQR